jgi:hypothetical protein
VDLFPVAHLGAVSTRGGAECQLPRQQATKPTFKRFHDAINTGDAALISKTIDEVAEPDVLIRTPLPVEATGAQALEQSDGDGCIGLPRPSPYGRGS